jgi:hypothetical protein
VLRSTTRDVERSRRGSGSTKKRDFCDRRSGAAKGMPTSSVYSMLAQDWQVTAS